MIDFRTETIVSMSEAARRMPGRPNVRTLWRWRKKGINGVKLETIKCGYKRLTSLEAVQRFVAASTAAVDQPMPRETASVPGRGRGSSKRRRESTRKELAAYGL